MAVLFSSRVNSSEYFPIFVALLWQAGLFFHQGENSVLPAWMLGQQRWLSPQVLSAF